MSPARTTWFILRDKHFGEVRKYRETHIVGFAFELSTVEKKK